MLDDSQGVEEKNQGTQFMIEDWDHMKTSSDVEPSGG